jgi:DNA-binding CsgD family transcriptional regulator
MKTTNTNRKQATTKARKQTKPAPIADTASPAEIITADNVQTMGERIAVRALKTCYQKGGQPFIYALYCGLVADITENKKTGAPLSDGYDIAQTASAYLCEYIGKTLQDKTTDGQTDKDGQPVTILRACFRAVNRYIMGERQHDYKRVYVDEIDENGATLYYEIPAEWDTPTATDYKHITAVIKALNLTSRQAQILRYRLSGKSIHQIADILKIHRKTLQEHMQALQRKYTAYKQAQTANA